MEISYAISNQTIPPSLLDTMPAVNIVKVGPETAKYWLAAYGYPRQRALSTKSVEELAKAMRSGTFLQNTSITFAVEPNNAYIIDGQHRLHAIVRSGTTQQLVLLFLRSESEEETAERYGRLDIGRRRTIGDYFTAVDLADQVGLTKTQTKHTGTATTFIANNFNRVERDDVKSVARRVRVFAAAARYFFLTIEGGSSWHAVERSATLSVALSTYMWSVHHYDIETINGFWHGAVFDDGVALGDPRKLVYKHLSEVGMPSAGGRSRKIMTADRSARFIAHCFNEYVSGRQLYRAPSSLDQPIKILGTPYNGQDLIDLDTLLGI